MSVIDNIRLTFLYIEFYSMGKTWVYPESYIPYNIFRYIVKGKAEFCIDGEEIIVKENQIVYIPQGCRMSCRALSESFEFYSLRFTTSVFYEGEDVLKEYYGIPRIIENEGEDYYFKEICKWVKKDSWVKKCFVRGYLDLLIGTLSMRVNLLVNKFDKNTGKVTEKNENPVLKIAKRKEQIDSRVQLVADYVVLHPREKYTPQKMAEMVELSKQRFSSLFKANMGKSPMEYVREIRLTTAARALLVSNKNINDIAGVRVVCAFPEDIFSLAESLLAQDDVRLIKRSDYVRNPKPNGYRSLHLIVETPIFLEHEKRLMKVEVQLRTISMNFWAALEHQLRYKKDFDPKETKEIGAELAELAEAAAHLDNRMQAIRNQLEGKE